MSAEADLGGKEKEKLPSRLLITGSEGTIGKAIAGELLQAASNFFRIDKKGLVPDGQSNFILDMYDLHALDMVFEVAKPDYIVHLAANPNPKASWDQILKDNILATRNLYESAQNHGSRRVVFASSTHIFGAYEGYPDESPLGRPIAIDDLPKPDSLYGTSKAFGELLARQYYELHGLESICIRIGSVTKDDKPAEEYKKLWLSHRDVAQVFTKALLSNIPFGIYFATSNIPTPVFDISPTIKDLGYKPQDNLR